MKKCDLVIIQTSDIHGNILPVNYGNNEMTDSGLAMLSPELNCIKNQHENVLLIDNGDVIQGTPLTYHYAKKGSHRKNPVISILNLLKYDAAILGNHEFNYGKCLLDEAVHESNFPWLSANIRNITTAWQSCCKT